MRLKELHIRNIASIEKADIDFEQDLNEEKGAPASIFLISGDTGAGKSVILDSISMALYQTTPRIGEPTDKKTTNRAHNYYTNSEGEQISIFDIEQYTRLGISPKDESYSEVIFEGNDGKTYRARLKLGIYKGRKDKATGLCPLKYRKPDWEIQIDNGGWIKCTKKIINEAIGLDFQQFGRMAMLAQGQFANFLTGKKDQREAILEQLTNTQRFSDYGTAIKNIYDRTADNKKSIDNQYADRKKDILTDEQVSQHKATILKCIQQQETLDQQIANSETTLKSVESILKDEKIQEDAKLEMQKLDAIIQGEKYRQSKVLCRDWDTTTEQRQHLANLQKARQGKREAQESLNESQSTFRVLSADLICKRTQIDARSKLIRQEEEWLGKRKQNGCIFSKAGEIDRQIEMYLKTVKKAKDKDADLKLKQSETDNLRKAEADADAEAQKADQAVADKEKAIAELTRQRDALNPENINHQLRVKIARQNLLMTLKKSYEDLQSAQKDAQALRGEIEAENKKLTLLQAASEKAESVYRQKHEGYENASNLLQTMQMSVKDTIVNLRRRLQNEHAETCPLCGQHIDHNRLNDDFKGMLTSFEARQQQAKEDENEAEVQRNASRDAYNKFNGAHQEKIKQLNSAEQKITKDKQDIEAKANEANLCSSETLTEQIESALTSLAADIARLQVSQNEALKLQKDIDTCSEEKKKLDSKKLDSETARTDAKHNLKNNIEAIARLGQEYRQSVQDYEDQASEISSLLAGYCENWLTDIETSRRQLADDAKDYNSHQNQLKEYQNRQEKDMMIIGSLSKLSDNILNACPNWNGEAESKEYTCRDIHQEWANLLSSVTKASSKLKDCNATISLLSKELNTYYQQSGKTEQMLQALVDQERQGEVYAAREFIKSNDEQYTSWRNAITSADERISQALKELGISKRCELPDQQQLVDEKSAANSQRDRILEERAQAENSLEIYKSNINRLKELEEQRNIADKEYERWKRLYVLFGNNRFRTLVQTYIMGPLLDNANIYLEQITDRYRLTCDDTNEQLSIFVQDRYNRDQIRSVTVLSGGERFMISLALSLALSALNRPDMNVDILFIDEGFGTLDEKSLDSVMTTLEKLKKLHGMTDRRVGIISHREELSERIPVQIKVLKKGEGRSHIVVQHSHPQTH